jgi:hypothetical protein
MSRADIRKAVFDAHDIPEETVKLPREWGGAEVLVRGMTAGELADYATAVAKLPSKLQSAELIVACVRDPETGERVFEKADRDTLAGKGARPFGEILAACHRLSGFAKPDEGEVADLKGGGAAGSLS